MRQQLLHSDATDHGSYAPNHKGSSTNNVLTEALLESHDSNDGGETAGVNESKDTTANWWES